MSTGIKKMVLEKLCISGKFAVQPDESMDISGPAQLMANVRFVDGDTIRDNVLFCEEFTERTT